MRKTRMTVAALAATTMLLAGCSSDGDDTREDANDETTSSTTEETDAPEPEDETDSPETDEEAEDTESDAPAASAEETELDPPVEVENPGLGVKAEVRGFVRNFEMPAEVVEQYSILDGAEVVLVNLALTGPTEYYSNISPSDFDLLVDGEDASDSTSIDEYQTAMRDAGYEPLTDAAGKDETQEGWVLYVVREPGDTYELKFEMDEVEIIGGDEETLPAVEEIIPLEG